MKRVRLRAEAREEFLHEVGYYEAKRPGTGSRFRLAVDSAMQLIRRFPGAGAPGPSETRRVKVKGFPFNVIYRDERDDVVVFAIAPDRRQPGYWLPRAK